MWSAGGHKRLACFLRFYAQNLKGRSKSRGERLPATSCSAYLWPKILVFTESFLRKMKAAEWFLGHSYVTRESGMSRSAWWLNDTSLILSCGATNANHWNEREV